MEKDPNLIVSVPKELRELIPGFLERRKRDVAELRNALTTENLDKIRDIGHKLKGNSAGYGFDYMSQIGAQLEIAAKAGLTKDIGHWIDQLEGYLTNVEIRGEK